MTPKRKIQKYVCIYVHKAFAFENGFSWFSKQSFLLNYA